MIRAVGDRIYFAHLRNVKVEGNRFHETSHLSADGSLDLYEIVKALQDVGFDGYIRPDHGRMLWGEVARPGYGLYDRALGAAYLAGLAVGYWSSTEDVLQNWSVDREFMPGIPDDERTRRLKGWNKAVRCSYGWAKEE